MIEGGRVECNIDSCSEGEVVSGRERGPTGVRGPGGGGGG